MVNKAHRIPTDRVEPWTFEDLRGFPDSPWRFEIIDGGLHMTPPPGETHEGVRARLEQFIADALDPSHRLLGPVVVDIHPSYLIPDLAVAGMNPSQPANGLVYPSELVLAVEVVSRGSASADRTLKPATYAAAGIPAYWCVETEPRTSLTAYTLTDDASVYTEVGAWLVGDVAHLTEPFHLDLTITDLEK
ncbi:Uma2 family endonuclease [Phytoactinopolyspora mesophila]|uniref:Uma2 family endonuclease n=1 Tax=Phytoactinopolyspora mesophila TaxID=2650750 RepID=UPI001390C5A2